MNDLASKQRRVMVIGLDAATLDLVRPWAEAGRLPHLARFLKKGAHGVLRSTIPAKSPAAWRTFATGTNPGQHGVLDFLQLRPDSYGVVLGTGLPRHGVNFWEVAGRNDVPGGVMNVPYTYPPRPFNGFVISGLLTPRLCRQMAAPQEAFAEMLEASPRYAIDVDVVKLGGRGARRHFFERAMAAADARLQAALGLYRRHRPRLFIVVFTAVDRVCHRFWHELGPSAGADSERSAELIAGRPAIQIAYEKLDAAVGALTAEAGDETDVIVLSDHGAGPLRRALDLRRLLVEGGLLHERRSRLWTGSMRSAVRAFLRTAPRGLKSLIRARFGGLVRRTGNLVMCSGIDFARTRAYPAGLMGGIFVNLRGRQPEGIVAPGREYERVRDEIIALASSVRDPVGGHRVVRAVHRREEIWWGPCLELLPDVMVELEDESYTFSAEPSSRGDVVRPHDRRPGAGWRRTGGHRSDGLLLAAGPHIRSGQVTGARIADVPTTVLALLGCDIPSNLDGRVLQEMLTDEVTPGQRIAAVDRRDHAAQADEDLALVERRLRGLGYL